MNLERLSAYADTKVSASDGAPSKAEMGRIVILYRMLAREVLNSWHDYLQRARTAERQDKKARADGMIFPYFTIFAKKLREKAAQMREIIIECGHMIMCALDDWQDAGATFADLCSLCNLSEEQGRKIVGERANERFSAIVYIHNLDYKAPGDWLEDEVDAPLTHAIKEYMLHVMLHTKEGRQASDTAFQQVFPEIWDSILYRHTDEDGNVFFTDKDGDLVDMEEDEP